MRVRGPNNVGGAVQTDPTSHNNSRQHATTCNKVCKRTQHVTSNNVGSCWPTITILRSFTRGFKVWPVSTTTCNRVCKRTQHVTSKNVKSYRRTMLHPFVQGFSLIMLPFIVSSRNAPPEYVRRSVGWRYEKWLWKRLGESSYVTRKLLF